LLKEQYPGWCKGLSEEEEKQWARSIRDVPSLHDLKVHEITTEHVLEALKPIWSVKPVTAPRTRQRTSGITIFAVTCWSSVCRIASATRLNCRTGTAR
jgi:hypothetical protein